MTQFIKTILSSFAIALVAMFLWAFGNTPSIEMTEDPPGKIEVIGNAGGDRIFTFEKWKIEKLDWTPGDFENIDIAILIDCKSLTHEWPDLEKNIRKKKDYFYVSKFPTANAAVKGAEKMKNNTYKANMTLTLKGITKNIPILFKVQGNGSEESPYRVQGRGELNKRKFNFNGKGPKNQVPMKFDIILK